MSLTFSPYHQNKPGSNKSSAFAFHRGGRGLKPRKGQKPIRAVHQKPLTQAGGKERASNLATDAFSFHEVYLLQAGCHRLRHLLEERRNQPLSSLIPMVIYLLTGSEPPHELNGRPFLSPLVSLLPPLPMRGSHLLPILLF